MTDLRKRVCCFTGHRGITRDEQTDLKVCLTVAIENLINRGICFYGCGGALGFDTLAGYTVLKLREKCPEIKLIMVLPCRNQDEKWSRKDKEAYRELLESADKTVYISDKYYNGCLRKRNLHLVENSSVCVAFLKNEKSGTAQTVRFAKLYGLEIINLAKT